MKKIIGTLFAFSLLLGAGTASAQTGMMGMMRYYNQNTAPNAPVGQSTAIDTALQAIYSSQNISSRSQLDCAKVSDSQFESLGDAAMGYGITEAQHTAMENRMGGEGSATLKAAHITMGKSYLGCWSNYNSGPVYMPMMGYYGSSTPAAYAQADGYYGPGGMMGYGYPGAGMMGGYYYGGYYWCGWVTMILVWAVLILSIIALVKWLRRDK